MSRTKKRNKKSITNKRLKSVKKHRNIRLVKFKVNSCIRGHDWVGGHGNSMPKYYVSYREIQQFGNIDRIDKFDSLMRTLNEREKDHEHIHVGVLRSVLFPKVIFFLKNGYNLTFTKYILDFKMPPHPHLDLF